MVAMTPERLVEIEARASAIDPREIANELVQCQDRGGGNTYYVKRRDLIAAADLIRALRVENARLREALEWYGENARLCRLNHSEGDTGRNALSNDGGGRASAALKEPTDA